MPFNRPVLDDRSFQTLLEEARGKKLLGHELTHVVQQMSGTSEGRRLIRRALQEQAHPLSSALITPGRLDRRTARQVLEALLSSTPR